MPRQTSFAAGELSPLMWGRTDSPIYGAGVRKLRNFFVSQQGAAVSRPGTRTVGMAYVSGLSGFIGQRLIPFVESASSTFLLELLPTQLRVWGHANSGPGPINFWNGTWDVKATFSAPWPNGLQGAVQYAQTGVAMVLTGSGFAPQVLRHNVGNTWTLTPHRIGPPPSEAYYTEPSASSLMSRQVHAVFPDGSGPGHIPSQAGMVWFENYQQDYPLVGDAQHPPMQWDIIITSLLRHRTTGETAESLGSRVRHWLHVEPISSPGDDAVRTNASTFTELGSNNNLLVIYPDKPLTLRGGGPWTDVFVDEDMTDWETVGFAVYRGRGGQWGFVGKADTTPGPLFHKFVDAGAEPNFNFPPPHGYNPFSDEVVVDPHLGITRRGGGAGNPTAVGFFEGRIVFGGCANKPQVVFASATGDYSDFDQPDTPTVLDSTALEFALASAGSESLCHFVPMRQLLVLTNTSVWQFGGANGPLAPDSVSVQRIDTFGSSAVAPLLIGGQRLLVLRPSHRQVALITPDGNGGYQSTDVSTHAQHLLSAGITSWCYAQTPWNCVWATTADGRLLSLTLGESAAWAQHDSQAGEGETRALFQSIVSIPEARAGDNIFEDAVYALVKRQKLGTSWPTSGVMCLERLSSRDALVTEGQCSVDSAVPVSLHVGDGTPGAMQSLTGLPPHFAGKKVWLVTKRNAPVELTVDPMGTTMVPESALTVGDNGSSVAPASIQGWLGFRFVCQMEMLNVGAGEERLRQKTTVAVGVEVDNAIGLQVGQDFDHLHTWKQRTPGDSYASPSAATELVEMSVSRSWDKSARAVVQQATPRPVTVLGLTRDVDVGGR